MKKDFKQFLILLIVSIFVAFTASFGYSIYQNYQREKKINEVKNLFNFGGTSEEKKDEAKEVVKTEEATKPEDVNSKDSWNNLIISEIGKDYVLEARPFYKKLYDKITGKKIYNFKSTNNENETLVVEMNDNKITQKFFDAGKVVLEKELIANDDFSSYDLKAHNLAEEYTATYKDMLSKDTYLNTKNGLIEYQDGRKIEFIHKNAIMNGPAIEYLANGDKIEFNYVNGKRYGEAQKFYANGDKEDFFYGNNEKKNGASIYFFADGEREEVAYKDGVLEGPAIYIFNDGTAEHYEYKNGKRVED